MALFLAVAGTTGALLAFMEELEPLVAPALFQAVPPVPHAPPLDSFTLRDRVLARHPGAVVTQVPLQVEPGRSLRFGLERRDPASGATQPYSEDCDELFVDPYSGADKGCRRWGAIGQGAVNLFPFLHRLHYTLALGEAGRLSFGIAALIWTLDCFVGFYLTLPIRTAATQRQPARGWFARWRPSWRLRRSGSRHKLTFDLHRAGGLWIWPLLLVFAWSGVAFNLPQVYDPVMRQIGYLPIAGGIIPPQTGKGGPGEDMRAAAARGKALMAATARTADVAIDTEAPASLTYYPRFQIYLLRFTSTASVSSASYGDSLILFSALTGEPLKTVLPRRASLGMGAHAWLEALHFGAVGGLPYRIVVCLVGLGVTMLSVTGVLLWLKKRSARSRRVRRRSCEPSPR